MLQTDFELADNRGEDTQTQTHKHTPRQTAKILILGFTGPKNSVNQSKSSFRKFNPRTIFSLIYMGKRK